MTNNNIEGESGEDKACYLPDFCHSENNLLLILVLELIAIVLALVSSSEASSLFIHVALISLYIQWVGLSSAAILCVFRRYQWMRSNRSATIISLLVVVLVTAVLALISYHLNTYLRFEFFLDEAMSSMIFKHIMIALILYGLALRYFYVQFNSELSLKTESQSRLQALQARIRPHFLFNSLNTIASLTYDEPERAETAIENLADLFRASLKAESSIPLQREIELTRDYINLESMRLDERLTVNWSIDLQREDIMLPALTLQPLVENAIYHGIEPLQEGGEVSISIVTNGDLHIQITNPLNDNASASHRQGNRMALENIRERLDLAFEGRAKIEHLPENDLYKVIIRIPITSSG